MPDLRNHILIAPAGSVIGSSPGGKMFAVPAAPCICLALRIWKECQVPFRAVEIGAAVDALMAMARMAEVTFRTAGLGIVTKAKNPPYRLIAHPPGAIGQSLTAEGHAPCRPSGASRHGAGSAGGISGSRRPREGCPADSRPVRGRGCPRRVATGRPKDSA